VANIRSKSNAKEIIYSLIGVSVLIFILILFDVGIFELQFIGAIVLSFLVAIATTYLVDYDDEIQTNGLTVWTLSKTKEMFKGSKVNDKEGEIIDVDWRLKEGDDDIANFSKNDMAKMSAEVGDLVYLCDKRAYLGGLKSVHAIYGEPHNEDGVVLLNNEHLLNGVFVESKKLTAEKEM
jgi:SSS family solute:Na+ symporter